MNLLQTMLLYFSLVFMSAVDYAPQASVTPYIPAPTPTAVILEADDSKAGEVTPAIVIEITPNPEYKTLKSGDSGDSVRELQEKLKFYGYYNGTIDGRYGNQTRYAVEQFQFVHGLSADGIAGKKTLTVLYESSEIISANPSESSNQQAAPNIQPVPTEKPAVSSSPSATEQAAVTPEPTLVPLQTVLPVTEQQPVSTDDTAESKVNFVLSLDALQKMDGFTILVEKSLPYSYEPENAEDISLYQVDHVVYYPLNRLLQVLGMNTIRNENAELLETAFANNNRIVRISIKIGSDGFPDAISAYIDKTELNTRPDDFAFGEQQLYVSETFLEEILELQTIVNPEDNTVLLTHPTEAPVN